MAPHSFKNRITEKFQSDLKVFILNTLLTDPSIYETEFKLLTKNILKKIKLKNNNTICRQSIFEIENTFNVNPEKKAEQLLLLNGILRFISNELKIKVPTSSTIITLINEKPVIVHNEQAKSKLSERLYILLEQEFIKPSKNLSYSNSLGRLTVNLLLNEGITDQHVLIELINSQKNWYRHDDIFYFNIDNNRQFVGQETVLLLSHHWLNFSANTYTVHQLLKAVNSWLIFKGIITYESKVSYKDLQAAFKIEHACSINPNALLMLGRNKIPKQVSHEAFMRLLTNKKGNVTKIDYKKSSGNKQWTTIFGKKITQQQFNAYEDPVKLGLKTVSNFLDKLTGKSVAQLVNKKNIYNDLNFWLEDENNIIYQPATWLVISWLYKLMKKGNVHKNITVDTIKDYVKTISKYFIPIFGELNVNLLSLDEWGDNFNLMITLFPSNKRQAYARYFISFLVDSDLLPKEILERIEIDGDPVSISANLISLDHAEIILEHLAKTKSTITIVARLVFCFGMFGGNRRGEVKHLQLRNITIGDNYANEQIYSRKGSKLKTPNANRNVALDIFWPETELVLLSNYIAERTLATNDIKTELFESTELRKAFNLITELLIEVTGDPNVGYHILRHSFCNWLLILISLPIGCINSRVQILLSSSYITRKRVIRLKKRLGISITASRKQLFALSEILGHGDVFTSLKHYFHLSEYYWFLHKNIYCNNTPTFGKQLFGYNTEVITSYPLTINNNLALTQSLNDFNSFKVDLFAICHQRLSIITTKHTCKQVSDNKLTLRNVFRIFLLKYNSYENIRISHDLGISLDVINRIIDKALYISNTYPEQSKYSLDKNPLEKLPLRDFDIVENISKKFDNLTVADLNTISLDGALDLINTISISKGHIIRSTKYRRVIELIRLLKILGFDIESNIIIKVHMVPKQSESIDELNIHINRYEFICKELINYFGDNITKNIQLILPNYLTQQFTASKIIKLNISFSSDVKYTHHKTKAVYSLDMLKKLKKDGSPLKKAMRDHSILSFFHMLRIWQDANSSVR